jgi:hypothetical protein
LTVSVGLFGLKKPLQKFPAGAFKYHAFDLLVNAQLLTPAREYLVGIFRERFKSSGKLLV